MNNVPPVLAEILDAFKATAAGQDAPLYIGLTREEDEVWPPADFIADLHLLGGVRPYRNRGV